MSSSDGHAHAAPSRTSRDHFDTIEKQDYAARLGMWLFLGTEVLLFAGLFLGYTVYRHFYHETFHDCLARARTSRWARPTRIVLITSSLTVALAYWAVKVGKKKLAIGAAGLHDPLRLRLPGASRPRVHAQVRGRRAARASGSTPRS